MLLASLGCSAYPSVGHPASNAASSSRPAVVGVFIDALRKTSMGVVSQFAFIARPSLRPAEAIAPSGAIESVAFEDSCPPSEATFICVMKLFLPNCWQCVRTEFMAAGIFPAAYGILPPRSSPVSPAAVPLGLAHPATRTSTTPIATIRIASLALPQDQGSLRQIYSFRQTRPAWVAAGFPASVAFQH